MQMMSNVITAILALIPQLGCLAASCDNAAEDRMDLRIGLFVTLDTKAFEVVV